jgi:two-component system chemotaxis response regulator CheB
MTPTAHRIRVLVAEDSPTARMLLVELLRSSDDFEVVGEAQNGAEAIERAIALAPDLIVMDVHMPVIDGLDATKEIMREAPTPILMVSASASTSDVALALSATQAGALMILEKPRGGEAGEAAQFILMAKAMAAVKVVRRWSMPSGTTPSRGVLAVGGDARPKPSRLVAIGTSTGGPAALHRILIDLPRDFPAPIVVVQHMARGFIDGLVRWLGNNVAIKVTTAAEGEPLVAGTVYVGPDDRHFGITPSRRVALSDASPVGGFRPSIDYLFDSAARAAGASLTAVVLTGMGQDGVEGLQTVASRGGRVLAQDEASSIVYGMAQVAVQRGLVDEVLPLESIGARLNDLAGAFGS